MLTVVNLALVTTTCKDVKDLFRNNDPGCCQSSEDTAVPYSLLSDSVDATLLSLGYRTGPYALAGAAYGDGAHAYINHHNAASSVSKLNLKECETGYSTVKATQCYYEFGNQVSAIVPLSTGATGFLASDTVSTTIPLLASGYGMGSPTNDYLHFTAPSYNDAITAFMKKQLTGSKVGFVHFPLQYGLVEIPHFDSEAIKYGMVSRHYDVGFPAIWGNPTPTNLTELFSASTVDAVFMMPWGGLGESWMDAAIGVGYTASQFTTIWWGAPDVMTSKFNGAKIASFVNPSKSPVSLSSIPSNQVITAAMGVRDAMIFSELVEHSLKPMQFDYEENSYPRKKLVTHGSLNKAIKSLKFNSQVMTKLGADGFSNTCDLTSCPLCKCNDVSIYKYNNGALELD